MSLLPDTTASPSRLEYSLSNYVYLCIRKSILNGTIPPNTKLNQLQLAEELQVNQRTVREALARLSAQGLAIHQPNRGVFVANLNLGDIGDVYRTRQSLEARAMRYTAKHISKKELSEMRMLLPKSGADQDVNRRFHWIAIKASHRAQLVRMLRDIWDLSITYAIRDLASRKQRDVGIETDLIYHNKLLEALEAGKGVHAARIVRQHIRLSYKSFLTRWNYLKKNSSGSLEQDR
jgi:DNA-binding GntR family transcriptional regulator